MVAPLTQIGMVGAGEQLAVAGAVAVRPHLGVHRSAVLVEPLSSRRRFSSARQFGPSSRSP